MNPPFNIESVKVDGNDMVKITVGEQVLMFTTEDAFAFSEAVHDVAALPSVRQHIDNVFDSWGNGDDGGTC